jgi:hypothetical protein
MVAQFVGAPESDSKDNEDWSGEESWTLFRDF